jgi:hypothetical protein
MTWAVMRVLVSSTGSVASSSQPTNHPAGGDDLDAGVGVLDVEGAAVGPQPGPPWGRGSVGARSH